MVHQTISVANDENIAFEIPPHIMRPRLHGSYRTFLPRAGSQDDETAGVDFLLMNQPQYSDYVGGRPAVGLFFADEGHGQNVNFDLPPSMEQAVKYYLLFRNSGSREKIVDADFTVDF